VHVEACVIHVISRWGQGFIVLDSGLMDMVIACSVSEGTGLDSLMVIHLVILGNIGSN
jgi:hypothetical protein